MNPFWPPVVVLGTLAAIAVKSYDDGKTKTPHHNVVSQLLSVNASSSATFVSSTAAIVVVNMITGALYDTELGHKTISIDAPSRSDLTYKSTADS
jgi:hypothetical protein